MAEKEIRLKVGELTAREEAGRGIVRLDSSTMQKLGIKEGDVVEIEGSRKSAAIAVRAYPADVGLNIIRMDGITRRNCGAGVGEFVKIRKAEVKEAKKVTLAPAEKGIMIHISPNLIKQNIYMRPFVKGDIITPSPVVRKRRPSGGILEDFFGEEFFSDFESFFTPFPGETKFIVTNTDPSGIVRVGDITHLEILPEAPEKIEERAIPTVTYEDVGGIKEIVTKVREMIELPLRHPELFERLGIEAPKGVLLYGPPGCGKTLLAKAVANESGANFISISGPEIFSKWYGQSLPGDALIFVSENGFVKRIPIGEIVNSNKKDIEVICFDEKGKVTYGKVTGLIKHRNKSKILEVRTRSGRKIKVTDYHSLFTLNGGKIESIKTSELIPGKSFVAVPRRTPLPKKVIDKIELLEKLKEGDYGLRVRNVQPYLKEAVRKIGHKKVAKILNYKSKYLYDVLNKNIGIPVSKFMKLVSFVNIAIDKEKIRICTKGKSLPAALELNEDFLTFLGLWIAEGSYTNKNEPRLSINVNELEKIKELCKRLFGSTTIYREKNSKAVEIRINSTVVGKIMRYVFELQDGANKKKVPDFVFNLSREKIAAFLRGYFSGDGSIYLNQHGVPQVEAAIESERLADDLMYLLLYFNIVAKNYERNDKKRNQQRVVLTGAENLLRFKTIGFLNANKNELITNYLSSIKWKRSDQIPITPEIRLLTSSFARQWKDSATIGRNILGRFSDVNAEPELGTDQSIMSDIINLVSNDIYWDRVEEIKEVENEEYVYDLSVIPNENFLAGFGGIFAHNTEENLRKIFEEAEKNAPSIIFIDEIDAIAPKREEVTGEVERRTVSQLLTLMDGLKSRGKVVVIAASNRPNALDPALRRAGRFDREIEIPVPDRNGRLEIFKIHTRSMPLDKNVDLNWLADITYGYVGADIMALCKEAAMSALRRVLPEIKWKEEEELPKEVIEKLVVKKEDFENALKIVEPSAMREVLVEVPKVKWEDIGGLEEVKQQLKEMVEWPLKNPEAFERMGITPPKGILLYGPPGCGKTLLAKAVANESGANFIAIKGPEVLTMWVGESERKIREIFRRARQVAPAIIFLDEIDALAPRRGFYRGSAVTETVVSQLLTEMSGIEETKGVVIIAATNRPDIVDPALLRPGRIDRFVLIPAPDEKSRLEILKVHTRNMPLKNVDLKEWAKKTEGFSGADIEALCREAAMNALRENIKAKEITNKHFEQAFSKMTPSITKEVISHYQKFVERSKKIREEEKEVPGYIG